MVVTLDFPVSGVLRLCIRSSKDCPVLGRYDRPVMLYAKLELLGLFLPLNGGGLLTSYVVSGNARRHR